MPRFCIEYLGICLTTEENHGKVSQGNRIALDYSALNAIGIIGLTIAGDGLDGPGVPCLPWLSLQATESTLGHLKYLPSCRTRGFPTSANFQSQLSGQGFNVFGKQRNAQILVYLPTTYVLRGTIARRKHLVCNTCNFRTWERAGDLHARQSSPSGAG